MNNSFVRYHLGICHVILSSYSLNVGVYVLKGVQVRVCLQSGVL